jgi:folate-binding protein YgfZ
MIHASVLEDRAVLSLEGPQACHFLQGLITNDVSSCSEGRAIYAALLTPQGKILFDFFVVAEAPDRLLIDCAAPRASDLMKSLTLYRLRAKVKIAARSDLAIAAFWGDDTTPQITPGAISFPDPRHPSLGLRIIGMHDLVASAVAGCPSGNYQEHRLALGIPDSADLPPDSVFALDAGFEELNGVSFKKGCYIGQEVTARMKHRSTARRRFVLVEFAGNAPPAGTALISEGRELGTLTSGTNGRALALVRLDRLTEAEEKHAPVNAAGNEVRLNKPKWFHG